jgi:hypothetical protein
MDRRQIGMKLILDGLGLPFDIGSFERRLILQKAVYLAQAAGVDLGYFFRWYLRGPYCSGLARDAFSVNVSISQDDDESVGWELDAESVERLDRVADLLEEGNTGELARKAELLASVHFLVDRRQVSGGNPKLIAETLRRCGKEYSASEVTGALGELRSHGLLSRTPTRQSRR